MSDYFIRSLTRADEPFLWEMLYQALFVPNGQAPFPRQIVSEPEIAKYVLGWGRENDQGLIAIDETSSAPVGAAWLRLFGFDNQGYGYIDDETPELSVAVLPEHRNRGIGTSLLKRLLEEAGPRYPAVSLSVSTDNPALHLYQRLGFEVLGQKGTAVTMRKKFDKAEKGNTA